MMPLAGPSLSAMTEVIDSINADAGRVLVGTFGLYLSPEVAETIQALRRDPTVATITYPVEVLGLGGAGYDAVLGATLDALDPKPAE